MDKLLLDVVLWIATLGFIIFVAIYITLAESWRERMGRYITSFIGSITLGLTYGTLIRYVKITEPWRTRGWIITLGVMGITIWSLIILLLKYQIEARAARKIIEVVKRLKKSEEGP